MMKFNSTLNVSKPDKTNKSNIDWEKHAMSLWQLLDDIDTASDIAKENDKMYRNLVHRAHMKRNNHAVSYDGYNLTFKENK